MPLGGAEGSQTIYGALQERGVEVTFKKAPASGTYVPAGSEEPFSTFVAKIQKIPPPTKVESITVRGKEITGRLKGEPAKQFTTIGDLSEYRKALVARGIRIREEPEGENSFWLSILGTWLPMIFIFFIFFLFMRQLQAGGGKAMSFGKSRHKLLNESTNKVTFKDIAGIDEAKEELQEIIAFLKDPKKFTRLGGRIPKGVLLMGPPGTGKTLLAKGVAGEAGVPFFSISGSDFVEMFVGVGASRVRDLFEQGKKNAPCIIFIDEIDAVGRHRGAGLGGGHDEREQTLNQLLVEMDGFESNDGVILIAATNRPDVLDPALLRPGRFDRRVVVNRPDVNGRLEILKVHTRKARLSRDVELEVIARGTPGFAGADLENLVNEAALLAARHDKDVIDMDDFEAAKDKVLMGAERRSAVLSDEEKRVTAFHEAGHTLVARVVPGNDPVHKVTIIPRGMALGLTWTLPERDQYSLNEEQVLGRIAMAMGGRVAEEIIFDKVTTGAGNDIEQATKMARKMVCEWGMSRLGPVALTKNDGAVFLGREMARASDFSEQTQAEADQEIKRILNECYDVAKQAVVDNRDVLERLANALLEFESLGGAEIDAVVDGMSIDDLRHERAKRGDQAAAVRDHVEPPPAEVESAEKNKPIISDLPEPLGSARTRLDDDEV
ncbi:MAG: ATP-dependent zinc metalloprotease FtsH [Deltaproteobacteria bacterium]|nr:MAG: ATP-dependent zinc metalloprotease FtsH [Deltaproteobacteria bacterium]